jgi:acetoin utilization protein AcuC
MESVLLFADPALRAYAFGAAHPFGPDRLDAFVAELHRRGLDQRVTPHPAVPATIEELARFHHPGWLATLERLSQAGRGWLDEGDTPAFPGVYEAAALVVGTTLDAARRILAGEARRAFAPIAGLHHARRDAAAGFCVLRDCGVVIEHLRNAAGLERIAYVDIDAHHGDGVYYAFESDPFVWIADLHEDGRFLYPGTGDASESGLGAGAGRKLNLPLPPEAGDDAFDRAWDRAERFLDAARPQFVLFQCGTDSLAGDPLTHLRLSPRSHRRAARALCDIADRHAEGRLLAMGGGGYRRQNLAEGWCAVLEALLEPRRA